NKRSPVSGNFDFTMNSGWIADTKFGLGMRHTYAFSARAMNWPNKYHRGVDLISDALPFGRLWYGEPNWARNAIGYAKHRSRSHDPIFGFYDAAGNVTDPHEPMKPTAPLRGNFSMFATAACRGLSLSC